MIIDDPVCWKSAEERDDDAEMKETDGRDLESSFGLNISISLYEYR